MNEVSKCNVGLVLFVPLFDSFYLAGNNSPQLSRDAVGITWKQMALLQNDAEVDETLVRIIADGFPLDAQFKGKDARTNAAVGTWIAATMA